MLQRGCHHVEVASNIVVVDQPVVVQKVIAQEVAPLVVTVPVVSQAVSIESYGVRSYYSARDYYEQRASLREIIRSEIRQALRQPQASEPPIVTGTQYLRTGKDQGPDLTLAPEIANPVAGVFKDYCLRCHGASSELKGGLRLAYIQPDGRLVPSKFDKGMKSKILGSIESGFMPPDADIDASKAVPTDRRPPLRVWAQMR